MTPTLTDLTLICLSYEKHPYLRRVLLGYSNYDCHVILADGSQEPWKHGQSGQINQLTWEYFHHSSLEGNESSVTKRLRESLKRVKTKYVCFLDDEEIIFPTGLHLAINELDSNPSKSCAGGRVAILKTSEFPNLKLNPWGRRSSFTEYEQVNSISRIESVISENRTANLYYQVFRAEDGMSIAADLHSTYFEFFSWSEVLLACLHMRNGSWSMGDYPYWIRVPGLAHEEDPKYRESSFDISQEEAEIIAKIVFSNGKTGEIEQLTSLIKSNWSKRKDDLTSRSLLNMKIVSTKNGFKRFLKQFLIVQFLKSLLIKDKSEGQTFLEYVSSNEYLDASYLSEAIYIEGIFRNFPKGIDEDYDFGLPCR